MLFFGGYCLQSFEKGWPKNSNIGNLTVRGNCVMNKEKIIIFGAGKKGRLAAAFFKYDKEILGIVDNDKSKWGGQLEGFVIYPLEKMKKYLDEDVRIVIAIVAYEKVVLQLEENGIHNYVYFEDVYANEYSCKCRDIMDENITDGPAGQYTGKWIKNGWMNHFLSYLGDDFFERIRRIVRFLTLAVDAAHNYFIICVGGIMRMELIAVTGNWIFADKK